jgi:cell division protein FtsL
LVLGYYLGFGICHLEFTGIGMTTRVGEIGSFVFERSRRGSLRRTGLALLIIAGLILYVGGKVKIVRVGYQIEELEREKRDLEREHRSLLIEASSLSSPARIEELAVKRLGMVRPAKENVVVVKRKGKATPKNQITNPQ